MNPIEVPEDAKLARPWCRETCIGPPINDKSGEIGSLPSLVSEVEGEPICVYSFWKPGPAELEALNQGGCIELRVLTWPMVPVSVGVGWLPTLTAQPTNLEPKAALCCCSGHDPKYGCPLCPIHHPDALA